jgi:hypothetical protein
MSRKILPLLGLLSILLISSISTSVFAQSVETNSASETSQFNASLTNATTVGSSPLPSLKIPGVNITTDDKEPTLPPFDPANIAPCNMTQVNAQRASNPRQDENHYGAVNGSNLQENAVLQDFNGAQYCISINDGVRGVAATQWIDTSYRPPSSVCLYAPTLKCPRPCPLEVSTVYDGWHNVYMIGIWDFSLGSDDWAYYLDFSSAGNYISTSDGRQYYQVRTCEDAQGDWGVFLYNFASSSWVEIYTQSNDNNDLGGWDMYEAKWSLGTDWPATLNVRSSNFQLYVNLAPYGWIWVVNTWAHPFTSQNDWNTGALTANGNYFGFYSSNDDWYAGAFYVQSITWQGWISGGGNAWDGDKLKGPVNDGQFARIYAGNYGDAGGITTKMIGETYGYIYVNGYGLDGYYNSHLYCYVSEDGTNWSLVGGGPQTVNYWDGQHNIYFGYSGNFKYLALAGYDDNGFSVNLCLDHVFIYR